MGYAQTLDLFSGADLFRSAREDRSIARRKGAVAAGGEEMADDVRVDPVGVVCQPPDAVVGGAWQSHQRASHVRPGPDLFFRYAVWPERPVGGGYEMALLLRRAIGTTASQFSGADSGSHAPPFGFTGRARTAAEGFYGDVGRNETGCRRGSGHVF